MKNFVELSTRNLYNAVYEGCQKANISIPKKDYLEILALESGYHELDTAISRIKQNAYIAGKNKRPLCQDTGQVWVYAQVGNQVVLDDGDIKTVINKAVSDCYVQNSFRKSVVNNAIFDRTNTKENTPTIVYTDIVDGDEIKLNILIKGGGAENMSVVKMFNPSAEPQEIIEFISEHISANGKNACPPLFLGVGIGGTIDYAAFLSKKSYFESSDEDFAEQIKQYVNEHSSSKVAGVSVLSSSTHIASLPVCLTVNCHSSRHISIVVDKNGYRILTEFAQVEEETEAQNNMKQIRADAINELKNLEIGEEFYLSGTIYTARDAAHKRLIQMLENGEELPFKLKDSVIFYAGPCPKSADEVIGPIGPTTSKRMDAFAPILYDKGVIATIGKGLRNEAVKEAIARNGALYLSVQGGVASLLQKCVKQARVIAFEDLGAEAIYELEVEKLPLRVELK